MKKPNKTVRLGAIALSAVLLGTGASLAAGDQSDPLVTLSYLNQTAIPQIVKQVEDKTALRQKELEAALADSWFFRCGKGVLVNLEHVSAIVEGDAVVHGETVQVSRARRKEFLAAFNRYINEVGQ